MKNTNSLHQLLLFYQTQVELKLKTIMPSLGPKTTLRDACEYALMNGGKRFRPALVLMIARCLNPLFEVSKAALAVEFFHTASLIADDLPCMDNDDLRRNKPSLHKVYGESTALLASYALIAAGYEMLVENAKLLKEANFAFSTNWDERALLSIKNVSENTGLIGASAGQYLDIAPSDLKLETIIEALRLKTVTLFEISFVLGWLFGGGDLKLLETVKKAAFHFGLAFQIVDDFGDTEQDKKNGRAVNIVNACGQDLAKDKLHEEINSFKKCLIDLKLDRSDLETLALSLEMTS